MAYGNNRAGEQPRAHFRSAGGSVIKFRHPYFAGMIDTPSGKAIDEIDISRCCKLEGRFFEANQNQDSAKQVVMIDGSTVTITNKMLNGTITIPAVPTTGQVATGDFIAGCQLIRSIGDTVGGIITKTDFVNGKAITKVYYGVTVQNCPDDVAEGNDVSVYNIRLLYAGWIEAESGAGSAVNKKAIWAVGSAQGIEAFYNPYAIQNQDGKHGTGSGAEGMLKSSDLSPTTGDPANGGNAYADSATGNADNATEVSDLTTDTKKWGGLISGVNKIEASKPASSSTTNP